MSVAPDVTRRILKEEIEGMAPLVSSYSWKLTPDLEALTVTVEMCSVVDQETYIIEARCDGYKALPPYFEFIHPVSGERGTRRCYPSGSSYFHSSPCICVQWNRKAYHTEGGPHGDWSMASWTAARPGTLTLGDMFHLIQKEINKHGQYKGRMEK